MSYHANVWRVCRISKPTSVRSLCPLQELLSFVLVVADELGPEGGEAYALGNAYGLLDPEAASAAAEALNEGLLAAMRPAAEPTQNQKPDFFGVQAEVLLQNLPVICFLQCHCKKCAIAMHHLTFLDPCIRELALNHIPHVMCPSTLKQAARTRCCMFLQAHSAAQQVLPDGMLGEPLEGAIEIAASCGLPDGLPSVARLLSDAVKGALPGILRPLQVSAAYMASAHGSWHPAVPDLLASGTQHGYIWRLLALCHIQQLRANASIPSWVKPAPWLHRHKHKFSQLADDMIVVRAGTLQVVNMVGSQAVQALLCQSVLYPRTLLRCAALREVALLPNRSGALGLTLCLAGPMSDAGLPSWTCWPCAAGLHKPHHAGSEHGHAVAGADLYWRACKHRQQHH